MPPKQPDPTPPEQKARRRTPDEQHRDRLLERIAKLKADRDADVRSAVDAIALGAEMTLKERISKATVKITARYADRLAPLQKMLAALGDAGGE